MRLNSHENDTDTLVAELNLEIRYLKSRLVELKGQLKEFSNDVIHNIESYEHTEKRYKEQYGASAKIDFNKLAEIRRIGVIARRVRDGLNDT